MSKSDKFDAIYKFISDNGIIYKEGLTSKNIDSIYDYIVNNIYSTDISDRVYYRFCGLKCLTDKNYDDMKKNFKIAIKKNDSNSMYCLGLYYEKIEHNEKKMLKYYLMAINIKNANAMNSLGAYYYTKKDFTNMIKYYNMAIEHGDVKALVNMGTYYYKIKKYDEVLHYYKIAAERGEACAMHNMGVYYQYVDINYDKMIECYNEAFNNGYMNSMLSLGKYYDKQKNYDDMVLCYNKIITNGEKLINSCDEYKAKPVKNIWLTAIHYLIKYYESIENYEKKNEFYTIGIKHGYNEEFVA